MPLLNLILIYEPHATEGLPNIGDCRVVILLMKEGFLILTGMGRHSSTSQLTQ